MAALSEVTYSGTEPSDFNPIQVSALGSGVFDALSNCILSTDLVAARGVENEFEFEPGQTAIVTQCLEVPDTERDALVYRMVNTLDAEAAHIYYTTG